MDVAFPCPACDKRQTFTWREEERKGEGKTNSKALILTSNVHVKYKFCLSVRKTIGGGGGERERGGGERERGRGERWNERTNDFFFINEGKGISTILFFIQPSGKTKSTKTIENKIIINSKTHINY